MGGGGRGEGRRRSIDIKMSQMTLSKSLSSLFPIAYWGNNYYCNPVGW